MKVDTKASFIMFVYPFLFDAEAFVERARAVQSAQWQKHDGKSITIWKQKRFPRDDLLAHVERYLNPPDNTSPTAFLWQMDGNALQPSGLGSDAEWEITISRTRKQIPFEWIGVQLSLFAVGVGLLTVAVKPKSDKVEDWLDFLHYLRYIRRERMVKVWARRRTERDQFPPFFPKPTGGLKQHPEGEGELKQHEGEGVLDEVLEAILRTATITEETEGHWWQEVFVPGQLIPFAVLYLDRDGAESISDAQVGELLYRVRNFFPSHREIVPTSEDLRFDHPALLAYAQRQWFVFSLEGGAFVAIDAPRTDFFRQTLPAHLRDQYFLLFLLALHQRFTLTSLSQQVSEHWLSGNERERMKTFERIRSTLLDFTARGYFTQVMQRENHHRVYRKWQEVFQLERIYQEVSDEVREMHEYVLSEQTKRLERRLNLLGALIGVPALVMGFLSINLYGITTREEGLPLWVALLLTALSFGLGGLAWWLLSKEGR